LKKHVLVVDDEPHIAELLKFHLIDRGFTVSIAHTIDQALRSATRQKPDVITLDMMLSDGLAMIERFKRCMAEIPIMVVTVADNPELCYEAGASCFLQKPFDSERLLQQIQRLC
jgi:DNA-binding response OmpR family regulator